MIATRTKPAKTPKKRKDRRWTFEELAAEVPESNVPTELWDGELIRSPCPSWYHQQIVDRFHDFLKAWVRRHRLGETVTAPMDMVLTPTRTTQPDILYVSKERLGNVDKLLKGPADLVAEVISPDSRRRDRIDKRDLYEQHGVRKYWLLDPEANTVEVLFLDGGEYRLVGRWRPGEIAQSRLLKGFEAPVAALFEGA